MRNTGLKEAQAGIKIAGRNINNLRYADGTTLMVQSKKELKSLLMKVTEESEKAGETMKTVTDFIFLDSKITSDGYCNQEIKRRLLLGRKVMINLDSILKNRDITLPVKIHVVKAMVFPVVMYGCESWTVKKAEH